MSIPNTSEENKPGWAYVRNTHPVERRTEATEKTSVCNLQNLMDAEKRCHRGVGYKNSVSKYHMLALSKNYETLCALKNGSYKTKKGDNFDIYEPKHRVVTSTKYVDRIPQACFIVHCFYPKVVPSLSVHNYACLKGRGVDSARNYFKEMLRHRKITDYVLKADLKDYFGSIDHNALVEELMRHFSDEWTMEFLADVVNSNEKNVGITLGSEINQLSAVAFLNDMDQLCDHGNYERYMDDIVFFGTKEETETALNLIKEQTMAKGVHLSPKKTYIQPVSRPIKFLGFTYLLHSTGRVTAKRIRQNLNNEKRKLKRMKKSVPYPKIEEHYRCVRETMKRGSRSGKMKLDKYYNELFKEEIENGKQHRT